MSAILATTYCRALVNITAPLVTIEAHLLNGLPNFVIVGLPEAAVRESKERVRSALINTQFEFPSRRITVNLGPADLPKGSGRFDLAIGLGILAASRQIPLNSLQDYEFIAELALSGELRPVNGILPMAMACHAAGRKLIIASGNAEEANLVEGLTILPAHHLADVCAHLYQRKLLVPYSKNLCLNQPEYSNDLADVVGQPHAKRSLEIAAAGGHHLLLQGPPGTGKTMLASRLPSLLPPMTLVESLEAAAIASISYTGFHIHNWKLRPFRAPHHSASSVALVGGGNPPRPGEISLAHQGILFLDELAEFNRHVLETLREPLESGTVTISRAAHQAEFPAQFQLIAAMNPCPCGFLGDKQKPCRCTPDQIQRYRQKISGPLLDRIDLHIQVPRLPLTTLTNAVESEKNEKSAIVRQRVIDCRQRQLKRANSINAQLNNQQVLQFAVLEVKAKQILQQAIEKLHLSTRAYHRILKVALTIADLANQNKITANHLSEALSFRPREDFY